ncbi:hypothetical protein D8674_031102 [Pyrus ussuriensis x Pyrus communis]|uniref:Uncharacterized protein n=1 Tax=Pyrus ussuriensis x Pyrus communis TaxID=2448454 RepID=A0A5N5F314_9ROSA|nr:hypothetical protein D8674_031102 [Pyrus ussuriensis x Pyrus communis]
MSPSFSSYFVDDSFGHSNVVAAIYAEKAKGVSSPDVQPLHSSPVPNAKHIWFTYSDDEDEDSNVANEDVVAETDASASPMHSNASSHSEEF